MRHPNALLARRLWDAVSDGDVAGIEELLAPGITWRGYGANPLASEVKGVGAALERMAQIGEGVDEMRLILRDIFASDRGAVIWMRALAERGPKQLRVEVLLVMRIDSNRIVDVSVTPMDQRVNDEFWALE